MVSDVTYCDRYWECIDGVAEQFDCPNGLVFAGRARGLIENCDYPWRGDSCEGKQLASKYHRYKTCFPIYKYEEKRRKILEMSVIIDIIHDFFQQTHPSVWDLVTGSTVSSDTNLLASVTGPAGTRLPLNNSVSAVCSTTKRNTLAIGPRPSRDARNIVRNNQFILVLVFSPFLQQFKKKLVSCYI